MRSPAWCKEESATFSPHFHKTWGAPFSASLSLRRRGSVRSGSVYVFVGTLARSYMSCSPASQPPMSVLWLSKYLRYVATRLSVSLLVTFLSLSLSLPWGMPASTSSTYSKRHQPNHSLPPSIHGGWFKMARRRGHASLLWAPIGTPARPAKKTDRTSPSKLQATSASARGA